MRRSILATALLFTMTFMFSVEAAASDAKPAPFQIDAKAAILIEATTGQVICEQNADEKLDMAGAIKAMTALVIMDSISNGAASLSDNVSISANASKAGGMRAFLGHGETYTVEQLLKAMMIVSANDAAIALSEKISGNQENMLAKMNEKSKSLEISPAFVNITGHNAQGQQMSAREAAIVARELIKHEEILNWSKIYMEDMQHPGGRHTELANPNRMVRFYEGCDGLITGSNKDSGYSGIMTAKRGNSRYIAVIIGAKNSNTRSDIAKQLLDFAFAEYAPLTIIEKGKGVAKDVGVEGGTKKTIHGIAGESMIKLLPKGSEKAIEKKPELFNEVVHAPIKKGEAIGELVVTLDGKELGRIPIISNDDVESAEIGASFKRIILDYLRR